MTNNQHIEMRHVETLPPGGLSMEELGRKYNVQGDVKMIYWKKVWSEKINEIIQGNRNFEETWC